MSSTFEGMARGLPMLCIPVFADQHRNSHKMSALNIARVISIEQVTDDKLSTELDAMLQNTEYTIKAKEIGELFNDYMLHPMDEAMYWIEHVIKSKGAKYMKSKAVNLSWFIYVGLDVWLIPVAILLALYLTIRIIIVVVRAARKRNKNAIV